MKDLQQNIQDARRFEYRTTLIVIASVIVLALVIELFRRDRAMLIRTAREAQAEAHETRDRLDAIVTANGLVIPEGMGADG